MILIHRKTGKKFYIENINNDFNSHLGIIKKEDLLNAKSGDIIKSHINEEFLVLDDNINDLYDKLNRKSQVINKKDIGLLLSTIIIDNNWRIVEGGTGSGRLTIILSKLVPNGFVYSYEIREDMYKIAKENLEKLNIKNVELKLKDITKGIDEKDIDLIILDIPNPYNYLDIFYQPLKFGGYLAIFLPNMTQVYQTLQNNNMFKLIGVYENFIREWVYKKDLVLRPKHIQLVHTEFMILFRKI